LTRLVQATYAAALIIDRPHLERTLTDSRPYPVAGSNPEILCYLRHLRLLGYSLCEVEQRILTPPTCRVCGCTDGDCSQCIAATGERCSWVEPDLCSRCKVGAAEMASA
jgi:hypothetical protein